MYFIKFNESVFHFKRFINNQFQLQWMWSEFCLSILGVALGHGSMVPEPF